MSRLASASPARIWAAFALTVGLGVGMGGQAGAESIARTAHITAELVPQTTAASPGKPLYVALHQTIAPGWHTYWRNPGDAGQPVTITWTLPAGWKAGDVVWAAPERDLIGPLMNYVYTDHVDLPVPIHVPADAHPGHPVELKAAVNWLVCKDVCIPEQANLSLELPVQAGPVAQNPHGGAAVAAALAAAPKPAPVSARFKLEGQEVVVSVVGAAARRLDPAHTYFFPFDSQALDQASTQRVARGPQGVTLHLPAGYGFTHGKPPAALAGVLSDGHSAFELSAAPGALAPAATGLVAPVASAPPQSGGGGGGQAVASSAAETAAPAVLMKHSDGGLLGAMALAFVGGLVLNLMPCVFPVLSMKAAALARHVERPAAARGEGLAFLGGVVASFVVLALALIAARTAGQAVGWGFQLQSPGVVAALTLLLLAVGLNLSGVFEAGLSLQNLGAQTASHAHGLAGAALTGVLAVVVAAPCSAPFMAEAMGWALFQPPAQALCVFVALGLGLAAPFTLIAFTPGLFKRLPKPGAWMEGLRKVLAFPMYAAAAWFAWVFASQAGPDGLPRLFAAALALAFACFCWGVGQRARRPAPPRLIAVISALGAALALVGVSAAPAAALSQAAPTSVKAAAPGAVEPWSPARVAELQKAGRPVFVDFTAAWCVTCQVNEKTALASRSVADAFARTHAAYLKADWTRPDPAISAALSAQGRSGVPLYLVYAPSRATPAILPQLLTADAVSHALDVAAKG